MAIQHSAIVLDVDNHEPKGAPTASARQIFIADGVGSGSFANSIVNTHGQIIIAGNTTAKTLVAAVDATLNTNSDYSKLTGASAPWTTSYTDNVTFTTDSITVLRAGYYIMSFWCSVNIASINNFIGFKYAVNGTLGSQKIVTQSSTANDRRNLSAVSIIGPLAANDAISVYVAGTVGTNITITDAGMMLAYLHA